MIKPEYKELKDFPVSNKKSEDIHYILSVCYQVFQGLVQLCLGVMSTGIPSLSYWNRKYEKNMNVESRMNAGFSQNVQKKYNNCSKSSC